MTLSAVQPQGNQNQTTQFALQANAVHLSPTTSDERYLLWLYTSDDQAFPLGQQTVDASGNLTGGVPLSAQQVLLLSAFQTIRFSKATAQEAQQIQQSLQSLQRQGRNARGAVPFVGARCSRGRSRSSASTSCSSRPRARRSRRPAGRPGRRLAVASPVAHHGVDRGPARPARPAPWWRHLRADRGCARDRSGRGALPCA